MRHIWRDNRSILALISLSFIPNTILQPLMFLLPVFTEEVLHQSAFVGGLLVAISGLGGLVAALIIASVGFIFRKGLVCLGTVLISSLLAVVFAYSQWLPLALFVIAMFAFSQSTYRTANSTLIQSLVPDVLRARITSLQRYSHGFVILSSLLVGWFAGVTSASTALTVVGTVA